MKLCKEINSRLSEFARKCQNECYLAPEFRSLPYDFYRIKQLCHLFQGDVVETGVESRTPVTFQKAMYKVVV